MGCGSGSQPYVLRLRVCSSPKKDLLRCRSRSRYYTAFRLKPAPVQKVWRTASS